jgi:hypothetical protein
MAVAQPLGVNNLLTIRNPTPAYFSRGPVRRARRGPLPSRGGGRASRRSVVCTRDRVADAGYACSARPDLHTVCRSFPKISSALSAKVCGGSRSAKILIQSRGGLAPVRRARRGPLPSRGGGRASRRSVVCTRDRVADAGYACSARPDLHTVCRSFPKISSALSAKVCGGSRSAKILIQSRGGRQKSSFNRAGGGELPPLVGYMPKPWLPLNVLIAAERALASGRSDG